MKYTITAKHEDGQDMKQVQSQEDVSITVELMKQCGYVVQNITPSVAPVSGFIAAWKAQYMRTAPAFIGLN